MEDEKKEMKSGAEWYEELYPDTTIYDFDGFRDGSFQYMWNEKLYTKEEFLNRFLGCTMEIKAY